jgi:hypothetical protein
LFSRRDLRTLLRASLQQVGLEHSSRWQAVPSIIGD